MREPASGFQVSVQMDGESLIVPPDSSIVGHHGVFLSRIRMPQGRAVVLRIRKGQELIVLHGMVCADCGELGVAVQFQRMGVAESQALARMFAPYADSSRPSIPPEEEPESVATVTYGKAQE